MKTKSNLDTSWSFLLSKPLFSTVGNTLHSPADFAHSPADFAHSPIDFLEYFAQSCAAKKDKQNP